MNEQQPFVLKDLVRTIYIEDALNGQCPDESDEAIQIEKEHKREEGIDPANPPHFAMLKTSCKVVKSTPYRLDHYAIVLCLSGNCSMTAGHYHFNIQPHSLHFIQPGMINVIEKASDNFQLYMVLFKREFFSDMYIKEGVMESLLDFNLDFPPISLLNEGNFERVKGLISQMDVEYRKKEPFHQKMIQSMLMQLFYFAGRVFQDEMQLQPSIPSRSLQLVQQFRKAVDQEFMEKRTVQQYADQLFVSAKYLGEIVKKETGETPIKLIHKRLYQEAHYLLNYSYLSVKEISDTLNFDTPSHFSRFFKQFAGYTPTEFKSIAI